MLRRKPRLSVAIAACLWSAALANAAVSAPVQQGVTELQLPRPPEPHERVWLKIRAGNLPRGAEIVVMSADGKLLGSASPYGLSSGQAAATYTIPLPKSAITDGHVQVRIEVAQPGTAVAHSNAREVESVELVYAPVTE
jgi:hypothetical protein